MNALEYAEQAGEIFVLSDSFIRIKELIDNEESTIDDIADVILIDPALAGTILKLANSSFFNYPGKIDTVSKAVLVLGITEVYNLVIAYFTKEAFKTIKANADYLENFWSQSVDCALLVKYLGRQLRIPNAERLFILGLLHNLGELVIHQFVPDKLEACKSNDVSNPPWIKQQEILGFTYGDCSTELLKIWRLPYTLMEPIRFQDEGDFQLSSSESQLLYLAKRVMMKNSIYADDHYSAILDTEKFEHFAIDEELLKSAMSYCDLERLTILAILNPSAVMVY
jgi:HD-like signal output (HDOD) protein